MMSQVKDSDIPKTINHPIFSTLYELLFRGLAESFFMGHCARRRRARLQASSWKSERASA
jgi:hypothetical protein